MTDCSWRITIANSLRNMQRANRCDRHRRMIEFSVSAVSGDWLQNLVYALPAWHEENHMPFVANHQARWKSRPFWPSTILVYKCSNDAILVTTASCKIYRALHEAQYHRTVPGNCHPIAWRPSHSPATTENVYSSTSSHTLCLHQEANPGCKRLLY